MKKIKRLAFFLSAFVLLSFTACSFRDVSEDEGISYETSYNPGIDELQAGGIPIVEISIADGTEITEKKDWKAANMAITGDFCNEDDFALSEIQIKGRGNSSWNMCPKKSYTIKLGSKQKVLGMKKHKRWVLIANYTDRTLLRNYYVSKLTNDLYNTVWNPSFKSVHLIINGKYHGVYILGEAIKVDKNRVDVEDISETDADNGGFIFEINQRLDELFNFVTTKGICISLKDPDEITEDKQAKVQEIIQTAEDVLFSSNYTDPLTGYQKYFDVDSVIDWYIVNEFTKNCDSADFSSIYYYYNPEDQLLHMGPNWDFDCSCGNTFSRSCDYYGGMYIKEKNQWINRMFTDPAFVERVQQRWNDKKEALYEYTTVKVQDYADTLSASAGMNFKKWKILGKNIWPNPDGFWYRTTYQSEVDYMINWLKSRYEYLDDAINEL